MKKVLTILLTLALVMGLMAGNVGAASVSVDGRVTGGGQLHEDGFKISFGFSVFVVDGEWVFHNTTVQFHNVSIDEVDGGKFKGEEITREFLFFENNSNVEYADDYYQVARFQVLGKFNGEEGYRMIIRIEDAGEPGRDDNIRIELFNPAGTKIYDTYAGDFQGESGNVGSARHKLDKGNFQVRGCKYEPEPV